jgi:hypothetical protein
MGTAVLEANRVFCVRRVQSEKGIDECHVKPLAAVPESEHDCG